jgi:energy-coupling factor transporter transmembrane protein EcfT
MIAHAGPAEAALSSPLGRLSPLLKLGVALGWLIGLAFTLDPRPPLVLAAIVLLCGWTLGRIPLRTLALGLAPLWAAAVGIGVFNALFSAQNADPSHAVVLVLGPFHVTDVAALALAGLAARRVEEQRFAKRLAIVSLAVALVIFFVKLASFYVVPRGSQATNLLPYARLADELTRRGLGSAQFVTLSPRDAGNLSIYFA